MARKRIRRSDSPGQRSAVWLAWVILLVLLCSGCSLKERMAMKEGYQHYKAQEWDKALEAFERAKDLNPDNPIHYRHIGFCYWNKIVPGSTADQDMFFTQRALESFQKYLTYDVDQEDAVKIQDFLINLYINQGLLQEGIDYYEAQLGTQSDDPRIYDTLARLYGKIGDFDKSLEYSMKRADLTPDKIDPYLFIGALCWERSYYWKRFYTEDEMFEKRVEIVQIGMDSLKKALTINAEKFEALLYTNLLYRQKADLANVEADSLKDRKDRERKKELQEQAEEFKKLADEYRDLAVAARKKQSEADEEGSEDRNMGVTERLSVDDLPGMGSGEEPPTDEPEGETSEETEDESSES